LAAGIGTAWPSTSTRSGPKIPTCITAPRNNRL
jgi:hypothetical protein